MSSLKNNLRINILFFAFAFTVIFGIWIDNLLVMFSGFIFLVILIVTNGIHDKKFFKSLNDHVDETFKQNNFKVKDKYVNFYHVSAIALNELEDQLMILNRKERKGDFDIDLINVKDIVEVSVIEDNVTLTKSSKGGAIGGMVVGGVLAGGVGAVVGGLSGNKTSSDIATSMILSIVVNDITNPVREVRFLPYNTPCKKDTPLFADIRTNITKWHKIIEILINRNN